MLRALRLLLTPHYWRKVLDLNEGAETPERTVEKIAANVTFRGTNLWILIFAILVCAVGLNVNSTAVIIGAMLISPLMGPIMGVGVGVGIQDLALVSRSARNLGVAVLISLITSTLYFLVSPLEDAASELLARTSPTLWDVLIAFFGGAAGIIAATRREMSNLVPGVAIATALMPPICTAGFGLANGEPSFLFGALYLFLINAVFISFSALLFVRLMRFPHVAYVDAASGRRVRRWVSLIIVATTLPSIYLAYVLVERQIFIRNANAFLDQAFTEHQVQMIDRNVDAEARPRNLRVYLLGDHLDSLALDKVQHQMQKAGLGEATLTVNQGPMQASGEVNIDQLRTGIVEDLYERNQRHIADLEQRLARVDLPAPQIRKEMRAAFPGVSDCMIGWTVGQRSDSARADTALVVLIKAGEAFTDTERSRMQAWMKVRTDADSVVVVNH